jgi:transcriptional regulator with XRE-family HTH domain
MPRTPSKAARMLRERRAELELSQFQVAELAGVREKDVSRWETSVKSPPLLGMYLVSKALGLDLYDLARALADDAD